MHSTQHQKEAEERKTFLPDRQSQRPLPSVFITIHNQPNATEEKKTSFDQPTSIVWSWPHEAKNHEGTLVALFVALPVGRRGLFEVPATGTNVGFRRIPHQSLWVPILNVWNLYTWGPSQSKEFFLSKYQNIFASEISNDFFNRFKIPKIVQYRRNNGWHFDCFWHQSRVHACALFQSNWWV